MESEVITLNGKYIFVEIIKASELKPGDNVYRKKLDSDKVEFEGTILRMIPAVTCSDVHIQTTDHRTYCYWKDDILLVERNETITES